MNISRLLFFILFICVSSEPSWECVVQHCKKILSQAQKEEREVVNECVIQSRISPTQIDIVAFDRCLRNSKDSRIIIQLSDCIERNCLRDWMTK